MFLTPPPPPEPVQITEEDVATILLSLSDCEQCGSSEGVEAESSRTQYHFDGEIGSPEDPNRDIRYCRACAKEHHEYWDSMWSDYYSGRL